MAHGAAAALLLVPHHGWPRNVVCAVDDRVGISAVARTALQRAMGFVGAATQLSAALHCEYGGVDDCGTRPPAVADLRSDADQRGILKHGLGEQRAIHADRIHGAVYAAGPAVYGADV